MFCKTVLKLDDIIQLVLNKCVSCVAQSKKAPMQCHFEK